MHNSYGDLANIRSKEEIQEAGVWKDLEIDGHIVGQVKVASMSTATFADAYDRKTRQYKKRKFGNALSKKDLDTKTQIEVLIDCLSEYVLLDWRGVDSEHPFPTENGQRLDNNIDNRRKLLSFRTYRNAIQDLSVEVSETSADQLEEDRGN